MLGNTKPQLTQWLIGFDEGQHKIVRSKGYTSQKKYTVNHLGCGVFKRHLHFKQNAQYIIYTIRYLFIKNKHDPK